MFKNLFCTLLLLCLCIFENSEAKRPNDRHDVDLSTGYYFVLFIFGLCFIPSIFYFIYSIWKDPATPEVYQRLQQIIHEKTVGSLSKTKKKRSD